MDTSVKTKHPERMYRFVKYPATMPKGTQRLIVLNIIRASEVPMTVREVAALAAVAGLTAQAGVLDSVAWHLHQMARTGEVKLLNPFTVVSQPDQPAAMAVPVIDFGV
jgi:hypothetical protein